MTLGAGQAEFRGNIMPPTDNTKYREVVLLKSDIIKAYICHDWV